MLAWVCACCLRDWWTGYAAGYLFTCMYGTVPIEVVIKVILLLVMAVLCLLCISCSSCYTFCCLYFVHAPACYIVWYLPHPVCCLLTQTYSLVILWYMWFHVHCSFFTTTWFICWGYASSGIIKRRWNLKKLALWPYKLMYLHACHILTAVQSIYCLPHFKSIWSLEGMLNA